MDNTPNLNLPYILPSQAQKHVTHNEALRMLDALVQLSVISQTVSTPPASVSEGDRYLLPLGVSGRWSGHAGHVALYIDGDWLFCVPQSGWQAFVREQRLMLVFDGLSWKPAHPAPNLNGVELVGINATADSSNRLVVASPSSLFNNSGAGHQLKVNKNAAADTASLLFQTNWSGRAEMGLAGANDFSIKVADDLGNWLAGLRIDQANGYVAVGGQKPSARLHVDGPIRCGSSTVAALPSATSNGAGTMIFVSNAAGGAQFAYSDGSIWRALRTGNAIT